MQTPVIETAGLTKLYGKQRGISNVTFSVEPGEMFGFIGPNGAGKSTTIRTLLALIHPTGGSAKIFGKDCIKEAAVIARDVGYLPSEVFYYDGMRVIDLLRYAESFYQKDCSARIHYLADLLGLDLKRKIDDLSLGNKKKVGIVQGLLHAPKLVILDEPTTGLDPLVQQTFFDLISEENKQGMTVLFSSHILSEVQKLCDRVAFLKDGNLLRIQHIKELQQNSYKKISLVAVDPLPPDCFAFDGVTDYHQQGNQAEFLFRGDINALLHRFTATPLQDLVLAEPTLEEIFLHDYR